MGNLGTLIALGVLLLGITFGAAWLGDRIGEKFAERESRGQKGSIGCVASIVIWVCAVLLLSGPLSLLQDSLN